LYKFDNNSLVIGILNIPVSYSDYSKKKTINNKNKLCVSSPFFLFLPIPEQMRVSGQERARVNSLQLCFLFCPKKIDGSAFASYLPLDFCLLEGITGREGV